MLLYVLKAILICLLSSFIAFASEDFLDKTLQELISERIGNPQVNCEIYYEAKEKTERIRNKQSEIQTISLIMFDAGSHRFRARVIYRNSSVDEVYGKYAEFIEAPVLARPVKAGEILKATDIILVKRSLKKIINNDCTEVEELLGKQLSKSLPKGATVRKNELVSPVVIKTNEPVNITYVASGIMLKTVGIALASGAIGDMIKVKNGDTGIVVLGQIINKNTVQVGANEE